MSEHNYYARRRRPLLRSFDWFARHAAPRIAVRTDAATATAILADARSRFEDVLPELPYIGGFRNIFTPVILVNGWIVALHRAMHARGKSPADVTAVCAAVSDDVFQSAPARVLGFVGRLAFTGPMRALLRQQAARSQRRLYAADFVYRFRETDDGEMTLVFDECAVNKFYEAQHVEELKPYCNFFDVTYSRLMGMGCDATETIGLGCQQCSLRYKHGRATPIPATLQGILPRTSAPSKPRPSP